MPELLVLCTCSRQDFGDVHRDAVRRLCGDHAIRWDCLLEAAIAHGVAPLVGAGLEKAQGDDRLVPPQVMLRFRAATLANRAAKQRAGAALAEFLAYCNARALPVMLVKGWALDRLVYRQPWLTVSADLDLVIGTRRDAVDREVVGALWRYVEGLSRRTAWGWECDWFEHHDLTLDGLLPIPFERIWGDAAPIDFHGQSAHVMAREDLLIAACIGCHRRRYGRLKLLCDVAEVVSRYPEMDWDLLWSKSAQYRCGAIVAAALLASRAALGHEHAFPPPPRSVVGAARARLIRSLLGRRPLVRLASYPGRRLDRALIEAHAVLPLDLLGKKLLRAMGRSLRRRG